MKTRPLKIGEVATRSGVPAKTIRFYEESGIIKPAARGMNHYRTFRESDIQVLQFIQRARALGFSLKDIATLLELYRNDKRASRAVKKLALKHVAELEHKITELSAIRDDIAALAGRCRGDDRPECPILEQLGAVKH